jgi:hypothetical protein
MGTCKTGEDHLAHRVTGVPPIALKIGPQK